MPKKSQHPYKCPRAACGRAFVKKSGLTAHLSQPLSRCLQKQPVKQKPIILPAHLAPNIPPADQVGADGDHQIGDEDVWMPIDNDEPPLEPPSSDDEPQPAYFHPNTHLFPSLSYLNPHITMHINKPRTHGRGTTLLDRFRNNKFSVERRTNLYYPFASKDEWEVASFLLCSRMSMADTDEFLHLNAVVARLKLSFKTAKELRNRCELLPAGPAWKCKPWTTSHPTKSPVILYYRNPVECLQLLMENPLLQDHISFHPMQVFETAQKLVRMYGQWITGDAAWMMQSSLPAGATLLGTVLSSDKTTLTNGTGDRSAHPLLISLANIDMEFGMKASNHTFLLTALLPIATFLHRDTEIRGVLHNRLHHDCVAFVVEPLKVAASVGVMMSDPVGQLRWCFTPLAATIVDTPEAALITGVGGKTSPFTMASEKSFGDDFRHPTRSGRHTLAQIRAVRKCVDPKDVDKFFFTARANFRLNGVNTLFWEEWNLTDPSIFTIPEPLHHLHKFFWDHDTKWCIRAVGASEIDFRFSILQPQVGFRHFKEGISKLKQVTGREHREIQRSLVAVISGAVTRNFQTAIRSLLDVRYRAQAEIIDSAGLSAITSALACFHKHKQAVIKSGGRVGKGDRIIDNFWIPKLEIMQSLVPSIQMNGVLMQYSADITERAHIEFLKDPVESTNNQAYETQICRHLDRREKCRLFDLVTAMEEAGVDFSLDGVLRAEAKDPQLDDDEEEVAVHTSADLEKRIGRFSGPARPITCYFTRSQDPKHPSASCPRIFTDALSCVAFHLTARATYRQMTVSEVAVSFGIPDLHGALADYLSRARQDPRPRMSVSGRRFSSPNAHLPGVSKLEVWSKVQIQHKSFHLGTLLKSNTIFADGPSKDWPVGHRDAAVVNVDGTSRWPQSGLTGHFIANVCLIFRIVPKANCQIPGGDRFLTYVQRYDRVPQHNPTFAGPQLPARGLYPEFSSGSYILKLAKRADDIIHGDVVPLEQLRALANLIPRFGEKANARLSHATSKHHSEEFHLNQFFYKDMYYALDSQTTVW